MVEMEELAVEMECFTKISDMTERYQDDLHGVLERNSHRPKTCNRESIVDELHE